MKIYDVVYDICNYKSRTLDQNREWKDLDLSTFMLNRWISMTSSVNARVINEVFNSGILSDKSDMPILYKALTDMARPCGKVRYIKRQKRDEIKTDATQKRDLDISEREARMYEDLIMAIAGNSNEEEDGTKEDNE